MEVLWWGGGLESKFDMGEEGDGECRLSGVLRR